MTSVRNQNIEVQTTESVAEVSTRIVSGHEYNCVCKGNQLVGLIVLVAAAVALIFAIILAAGVFGGGEMGLIAGALTVGSMLMFAIAAVLLVPKQEIRL